MTLEPGWYIYAIGEATWYVVITQMLEEQRPSQLTRLNYDYFRLKPQPSTEWRKDPDGRLNPPDFTKITPPEDVLLGYMKWLTAGGSDAHR